MCGLLLPSDLEREQYAQISGEGVADPPVGDSCWSSMRLA
jgi:hypothetical protein